MSDGAGPLAGLRVIELSAVGPGPHAGMILADLGADVIRVDRPGGRQLGRPDASDPMLRGRRRVDANLKTERGRRTVLALVEAVAAIEPHFYEQLLPGLGLAGEDLPAQRDPSGYTVLTKRFAEVFATRTRDEWAKIFAGLLAATVVRAVVSRSGVDPERIDDVVFAQSYANSEVPCVGRWVALHAGLPVEVPGMQLDRRCGGGLRAVPDGLRAGAGRGQAGRPHRDRHRPPA